MFLQCNTRWLTFVSCWCNKRIPERGCGHLQRPPHKHRGEHTCGMTRPWQLVGSWRRDTHSNICTLFLPCSAPWKKSNIHCNIKLHVRCHIHLELMKNITVEYHHLIIIITNNKITLKKRNTPSDFYWMGVMRLSWRWGWKNIQWLPFTLVGGWSVEDGNEECTDQGNDCTSNIF